MKNKLNNSEINQFIHDGYIRLNSAFSREIAEEAVDILWRDTNCDPNDPNTWTLPGLVIMHRSRLEKQ